MLPCIALHHLGLQLPHVTRKALRHAHARHLQEQVDVLNHDKQLKLRHLSFRPPPSRNSRNRLHGIHTTRTHARTQGHANDSLETKKTHRHQDWTRVRQAEQHGKRDGRHGALRGSSSSSSSLSERAASSRDEERYEMEEREAEGDDTCIARSTAGKGRASGACTCRIISKDMESYNTFLNTMILDHPSVRSASSSFALRRVKYTTALPLQD